MSASNFNLRGVPKEFMDSLKQEAKKLHISVNTLILRMIQKGLGFTHEKTEHHDLDDLAGTWSDSDAKDFEKNTEYFEKIDKELWS
jgi:hypothetical protein